MLLPSLEQTYSYDIAGTSLNQTDTPFAAGDLTDGGNGAIAPNVIA